jgi:RNA-directed DNA polymerase
MRNFHTSSRLEDDINACCDEISHAWLLANIAMDEAILQRWLKAGDVAEKQWSKTETGTSPGRSPLPGASKPYA